MPHGKLNMQLVREAAAELRRERAEEIRQAIGPEKARELEEQLALPFAERRPVVVHEFPVNLVHPGVRVREDMGDIEAFAQDIAVRRQLAPIRILPHGLLVNGERRLLAIQLLGWKTIRAEVIATEDRRGDELAENTQRKDLTPEEKYYEVLPVYRQLQVLAKERQREAGRRVRSGVQASEKVPEASTGEALRLACKGIMSPPTFRHTGEVLEAAYQEPEKYDALRRDMNVTGKVNPNWAKLLRQKRQEEMRNVPFPPGRFPTIVIDPPWPLTKHARAENDPVWDYPTLSIEEIEDKLRALIDEKAAADGAHIYLWSTQTFMAEAFALFKRLGIEYAYRLLSWEKTNQKGETAYPQPSYTWCPVTEFILFGRVGSNPPPVMKIGVPTHFRAPRREHSRKPDEFYRLVEKVSPGPYFDAFGRGGRGDKWVTWGDEAGLFDQRGEESGDEPAPSPRRRRRAARGSASGAPES